MPMILEHIDAIAREKNRDVLFLRFHPTDSESYICYEHKDDVVRTEILENLKALEIPHKPCLDFYHPDGFNRFIGQIYLDVPYDENLPLYQKLQQYLEYPDGTMRFPTVRFLILPLEKALVNKDYDNEDDDDFY